MYIHIYTKQIHCLLKTKKKFHLIGSQLIRLEFFPSATLLEPLGAYRPGASPSRGSGWEPLTSLGTLLRCGVPLRGFRGGLVGDASLSDALWGFQWLPGCKISCWLFGRLASLGTRALSESPRTITALSYLGVQLGPSIVPPLCRGMPVSRTADVICFQSGTYIVIFCLLGPALL